MKSGKLEIFTIYSMLLFIYVECSNIIIFTSEIARYPNVTDLLIDYNVGIDGISLDAYNVKTPEEVDVILN